MVIFLSHVRHCTLAGHSGAEREDHVDNLMAGKQRVLSVLTGSVATVQARERALASDTVHESDR